MTMKAHTYYIIFGRPPIGGSFPPFPPGGATAFDVCYIYFDETKPLPTLLTGDNRLTSSFPLYSRDMAPLLWARSARGH